MKSLKKIIREVPIVGSGLVRLNNWIGARSFEGSSSYWEDRYRSGGNSGPGSYGRLAHFKAEVINDIVREFGIRTIAEFGCGDGNQLKLARYSHYVGYDVSDTVLDQCRRTFANEPSFSFRNARDYAGEMYDLSMSLDVIFHLVEDQVFHDYMDKLFRSSDAFVLVYSSDFNDHGEFGAHVRNRDFKPWVTANYPNFELVRRISNAFPFTGDHDETSFCDFFLYRKA